MDQVIKMLAWRIGIDEDLEAGDLKRCDELKEELEATELRIEITRARLKEQRMAIEALERHTPTTAK